MNSDEKTREIERRCEEPLDALIERYQQAFGERPARRPYPRADDYRSAIRRALERGSALTLEEMYGPEVTHGGAMSEVRSRRGGLGERLLRGWASAGTIMWIVALLAAVPCGLRGQVPTEVTLHGGWGSTLVESRGGAAVRVTLWEATQDSSGVHLTTRVPGAVVWPDSFPLEAGGRQTVRLYVPEGEYTAGTVLRLLTVVTPAHPRLVTAGGGRSAALYLRLRYITKVWVR